MSRMIFINHAVADLAKSIEFFTALGFTFNPAFTDDKATCLVINDRAFVMLLTTSFFDGFHDKQTADAMTTTETLLGLSAGSREEVDDLCNRAFAAGGVQSTEPNDQGFMYGWGFQDLDGHLWEVMWMDPQESPA
ncbi:MAG: hypothetical protein JWR35_2075 [Marmoricola sp.]|jgi:predicted lactoylglutathione lyase|nr:hypothetical protein [Marmoricola sp.]